MGNPTEAGQKYDGLHRYIVSMEEELRKMKRIEKVRFEMEQRYMGIMESGAFIYALLAADGTFHAMNVCAEKFFGFQPRLNRVTLQSLAGPGCVGEVEAALKDAFKAPVRFPMSVVRASGALGWLDAEFFISLYQGAPAIQILAFDITDQVKKKSKAPPEQPASRPEPANAPARDASESNGKKTGSTLEILNAIPEMILVIDSEARCTEANRCFLSTLRLSRDEAVGHMFADLFQEGDLNGETLPERIAHASRGSPDGNIECRFCAKDGEIFFLSMKTSPLRADASTGGNALTLVSFTDNTKLRRMEEQLKRVSTTDTTTGILNRQGLERLLLTETERASRYRGSLALIFFDVDGFRHLNESIGYAASDHVLRELTAAIKSNIRPTDFIGRWDGDEFLIMTPVPMNAAFQLAEKVRDMVEHKIFEGNGSLTLSAGVVEYRKFMDMSAFVGMAYDAMTEAKRAGGNRTMQAKETETAQDEPTD